MNFRNVIFVLFKEKEVYNKQIIIDVAYIYIILMFSCQNCDFKEFLVPYDK